jgi:hypothetical protein
LARFHPVGDGVVHNIRIARNEANTRNETLGCDSWIEEEAPVVVLGPIRSDWLIRLRETKGEQYFIGAHRRGRRDAVAVPMARGCRSG